jgi:hypothetical protein
MGTGTFCWLWSPAPPASAGRCASVPADAVPAGWGRNKSAASMLGLGHPPAPGRSIATGLFLRRRPPILVETEDPSGKERAINSLI